MEASRARIASYFFLRAVPILTAKNESDPVLQPCGTPGSRRRRTGREISEEEHLCEHTRLLLDLDADRVLAVALGPGLADSLGAVRLVELDQRPPNACPSTVSRPGDDHDAVLEALRRHREADSSGNDGLPLGRAARIRGGVPATYGVNVARQMRSLVLAGFVNTPLTSKNANSSWAPAGVPIGPPGRAGSSPTRTSSSGADRDWSTYSGTVQRRPCDVMFSFQTAWCSAGQHTGRSGGSPGLSATMWPSDVDLGVPAVAEDQLALTSPIFVPGRLREVDAVAERRVDRVLRRRVIRLALDVAEQQARRRSGLVARCGDSEARRVRGPG